MRIIRDPVEGNRVLVRTEAGVREGVVVQRHVSLDPHATFGGARTYRVRFCDHERTVPHADIREDLGPQQNWKENRL